MALARPSDTDYLQAHLDFVVDDLDTAETQALEIGARTSEFQPHPDSFRVYLNLAKHPLCLCKSSAYD